MSKSVVGMAARPAVAGPSYSELVQATVAQRRLADTFVDTTCDPPRVFTFGGMIGHVISSEPYGARSCRALESAGVTDLGQRPDARARPRVLTDAGRQPAAADRCGSGWSGVCLGCPKRS